MDEIPSQNLVDVRFEDLEHNALGTMKKIYTQLHLTRLEDVEGYFRDYIRSQKGYQKKPLYAGSGDAPKHFNPLEVYY